MSVLRLAVIGGGHLGRIHAKLANSSDQFQVVAVADPSAESRKLVDEQLHLPTVADYKELLSGAEPQMDAAIVAAPTVAHYEVTSALLRAGIHCLVEKPLAVSADQAHRLVQIAKSHRRKLQVGHVERFNPIWTEAQTHLEHPKFIEAVRAGAYSGRSTDIGVVMDLMIHDLDLILSMEHSPVTSVQASGIAVLGSHEDIAEARIQFESGCIANLRASRLSTTATRRMQIYTAGGYAEIDFSSDELRLVKPSLDVLSRAVALDELPASERMAAKEKIFEDLLLPESVAIPKRNAILDEQNDFALSIQTGSQPSVSGLDGARAVEVATKIVDTIQSHAWDGTSSKPWRIGALAMQEPKILSLPAARVQPSMPNRKAG